MKAFPHRRLSAVQNRLSGLHLVHAFAGAEILARSCFIMPERLVRHLWVVGE